MRQIACLLPILLALSACARGEAESDLSKRVCGVTIKDPAAWLMFWDEQQGHHSSVKGPLAKLGSDVGQATSAGELYEALANCMFNEGRDLAASGEGFEAVYVASKARCQPFRDKLERWGYEKDMTDRAKDFVISRDDWLKSQEESLRKDAQVSFVADRAGRCWEHPHYVTDK